jgi:L-fuconolactonase
MIVDTHCHISAHWYEPCETLLYQMDSCGVDRAWLVQLLGHYKNDYQQNICLNHPDRFVSIVGVDWMRSDAVSELERLAIEGVRGVRLRPGSRSPGEDPLAIWRKAQKYGLVVSCVGTAAQFADPDFAALLVEFPKLSIVLEHLGGLARPDVGDVRAMTAAIVHLAKHRTVSLKLPGLGQLMAKPALASPPNSFDDVSETPIAAMLTAFGPERLMWASDFPVVSSREGYANALNWVSTVLPSDMREMVLGGTAESILLMKR